MSYKQSIYKLILPDDISDLIRTLHPHLKKKIKISFSAILSEPYSGKLLMEELAGLRSFRVGSFRIIYRIKDKRQIEVVAIGPRELIYKETYRIISNKKRK